MAKISISIDDDLLARIDRAARIRGLSRSGYLSRLASSELGPVPRDGRQIRTALANVDRLFAAENVPEDSTRAIRDQRDGR